MDSMYIISNVILQFAVGETSLRLYVLSSSACSGV